MNTKFDYEYIKENNQPGWQQQWKLLLEGRFIQQGPRLVVDQNAKIFRMGFTVQEVEQVLGVSGETDREKQFKLDHPEWQVADPDAVYREEQRQLVIPEMEAKIAAEEDHRSYLPLLHNSHNFKVSSAIQNTKLILLGADLTSPLPINNGCWDDIDGTPVAMTVGEFFDLAQAAYARGAMNYAVRKAHVFGMKESDDPASYDYSGGWA